MACDQEFLDKCLALEKKFESSKNELADYKLKNQYLYRQIVTFQNTISKLNQRDQFKEQKVKEISQNYWNVLKQQSLVDKELFEVKSDLMSKLELNSILEKNVLTFQSKAKELEAELSKKETKILELEKLNVKNSTSDAQIRILEQNVKELRKQFNGSFRTTKNELAICNRQLVSKNRELEKVKKELQSMKTKNQTSVKKFEDKISSKNTELKNLKQSNQSKTSKVLELENQIGSKNSELEELDRQFKSELEMKNFKISELENALKKKNKRFSELSKNHKVLESRIHQSEKRKANSDVLSKNLQDAKVQLSRLRLVQKRRTELSKKRECALKSKIKKSTVNYWSVLRERNQTKKILAKLKKEMSLKEELNDKLEEKIKSLEANFQKLKESLSSKESELEKSSNEVSNSKSSALKLEAKNRFLRKKVLGLSISVQSLNEIRTNFEQCSGKPRSSRIAELEKKNSRLIAESERHRKTIFETEEHFAKSRQLNCVLQMQSHYLEQKVKKYRAKVSYLKAMSNFETVITEEVLERTK